MSDKVELVAAAQIAVDSTGISFRSNHKFKTASRSSPGVYELELDDKHDGRKLVVQVTPDNLLANQIQAAPVSLGDTRSIQLTNFQAGVAADTSFFITVYRIRS
jgi:hypothetical protein